MRSTTADIDVKLIATRRGDPFELNFHFTGTLTLL